MSQPTNEIWKITLTPVGRFFFGGEIVFGGADAQDDRRRSYIVESRIFPQQTSVLGMLREQLLRENDLLFPWSSEEDKERAVKLVGDTGFSLTFQNGDTTARRGVESFGFIQEISPLFLQDTEGEHYQPAPLDDGKGKEGQALRWSSEDGMLLLKHYDPKHAPELRFVSKDGLSKPLSAFFTEQHQVGITVTNRRGWREDRKDDKEAFFRQTFLKNGSKHFPALDSDPESPEPSDQYAFCCWVKLKPGLATEYKKLQDATVTMGGEQSTFRLREESVPTAQDFESCFSPVQYTDNGKSPEGYARLLLLSDTYLPRDAAEALNVFPVAHSVSFRFFATTLGETTNFYELSRDEQNGNSPQRWKKSGRRQSRRYTLLQRGGVLLVPEANLTELINLINHQTAFRQIGYNYTQKI